MLKKFTIYVTGWADLYAFEGTLKLSNGNIQFRVLNGFERIITFDLRTQLFNVDFLSNSTSSDIQLNAVRWMKEHKLYDILIANREYDTESLVEITQLNNIELR